MDADQRKFLPRGAGLFFLMLSLGGCTAPALDAVCSVPKEAPLAQQVAAVCACQNATVDLPLFNRGRSKVDLLVVVGNTPGMALKQKALAQVLASLPQTLAAQDDDYHIGVVSTDVGSWTAANTPWTMSAGACDSFAGDDGRLQATSCLDRSSVSAVAGSACATLCPDRKFLPTDGRPYIAREHGKTNVPSALEPDPMTGKLVDRGPEYALKCMSLLGDAGCSVSSPLESARRALDGHLLQNSGFLRPDSLLEILFLTDVDDCSLQLSHRADNDPHTQSCATPDADAAASCYNLGAYRCLARDLTCDQPMNVAGAKTNCHERSDSGLESVVTYARFFASLHPSFRIAPIGIWTLPALPSGGQVVVEQDSQVSGSAGLILGRGGSAGCQSVGAPVLTGSAQLRLSQFMAALNHELGLPQSDLAESINVCDTTAYSWALTPFTRSINIGYEAPCLPGLPRLRPDGSLLCQVGDIAADSPFATPATLMPQCGTGCCTAFANTPSAITTNDPNIQAACSAEPADCFCAGPSTVSRVCPGLARLGVWRKDNLDPPPDTSVSMRCAVQCSLGKDSSY